MSNHVIVWLLVAGNETQSSSTRQHAVIDAPKRPARTESPTRCSSFYPGLDWSLS